MVKYENIMQLRNHALELNKGMEVYLPATKKIEELPIEGIPELYEHNYSKKNGIICFVYKGKAFVIPEMWNAIEVLLDEGFHEAKIKEYVRQ